jgi:hypothetical protein
MPFAGVRLQRSGRDRSLQRSRLPCGCFLCYVYRGAVSPECSMLGDDMTHETVRRASRAQDAVRLLFVLDRCGAPYCPPTEEAAPLDVVAVIRGQKRLQALDFWLRNPDYLADELLAQVEDGSAVDSGWALTQADLLLEGDEPDVSRYPMVRWRFGAWEPLDDALALLPIGHRKQTQHREHVRRSQVGQSQEHSRPSSRGDRPAAACFAADQARRPSTPLRLPPAWT